MNVTLFAQVCDDVLQRHFGISINDTWLSDPGAIASCVSDKATVVETINEIVEEVGLDRIDDGGRSQYIGSSPLVTNEEFYQSLASVSGIILLSDQPTCCPYCGSRTDFDSIPGEQQHHRCLNVMNCGFEFIAEDDDEDDEDEDCNDE